MIYTQSRHEIYPKEDYHHFRQENASANSSLISVLALATVAMVGLTLAGHFGAFAVSSAGQIGCYVVTGSAGLALIVAIASRCIGCSKSQDSSKMGLVSNTVDPQEFVEDEVRSEEQQSDDMSGGPGTSALPPLAWDPRIVELRASIVQFRARLLRLELITGINLGSKSAPDAEEA